MIKKGGYVRDILAKPAGTAVEAYGWVKTRRDSKGVHFLQLNDGSGFKDLQVVIEAGQIRDETLAQATTGPRGWLGPDGSRTRPRRHRPRWSLRLCHGSHAEAGSCARR